MKTSRQEYLALTRPFTGETGTGRPEKHKTLGGHHSITKKLLLWGGGSEVFDLEKYIIYLNCYLQCFFFFYLQCWIPN